MDPKLIAALIGLIVELTVLVKVYTDILKMKADRADTKQIRDKDSQDLHDTVQKLTWENARFKEDLAFVRSVSDDHQLQLSALNTELAKVSTKLDSALEILHDLKDAKE